MNMAEAEGENFASHSMEIGPQQPNQTKVIIIIIILGEFLN